MPTGKHKNQSSIAKQKRQHSATNLSRRASTNPRTKPGHSKTRKNHSTRFDGKSKGTIKKQVKDTTDSFVRDSSQKAAIEGLLENLADESLRRSHQSVHISFTQMLEYIKKIKKPVKHEHIRLLLDTYSDHIVLPDAQRLALYGDIAAVIERHGGSIEIPYVALLFLAFRQR